MVFLLSYLAFHISCAILNGYLILHILEEDLDIFSLLILLLTGPVSSCYILAAVWDKFEVGEYVIFKAKKKRKNNESAG